jgi:hypothetical protein
MNKHQERKMAMLERIDNFLTKNPLTPTIARVTALAAEMKGALTAMRQQGGDQQGGLGEFKDGASRRQTLRRQVYGDLREISDTVTSLNPAEFPGVGEQFHLPRARSYQRILDTARAFLGAIGPVKAALIERGFAADFDEALQALVTDFEAATDTKNNGRQRQRTNTAALALTAEEVRLKRLELDAIVSKALKTSNPALLAAWKDAVRVYSGPHRSTDGETTGNPSATATATAAPGTPAPVPATSH